MTYSLPLQWFLNREQHQHGALFLRQPINRKWKTWTYRQAGEEIRCVAAALAELPPRSNVAILSKNCAHWIMADLAIMIAGHVSVPIYPTLSDEAIRSILEQSQAAGIIIGKLDNYQSQQGGIPDSVMRISIAAYGIHEGICWEKLTAEGKAISQPVKQQYNDLMTIIYTSGTTGKPKGVMHTAGNFAEVIREVDGALPQLSDQPRMFSYLPLSHIAERVGIEMLSLYKGAMISFAETIDTFAEDLKDTQPAVFFAVPRIWSKIQEKILSRIEQKKLNILLAIPGLNTLIRKKLKKELGLSRAIYVCSGAAPLSTDVMLWFKRLGITIHQDYGMTEDCVLSHFNLIGRNKWGSVGRPLPGAETRISEEGEVRIRSKALMKGYYKEPELTAQAFDEAGFLRTGDMGRYDEEGYLFITGRLKDQFKTDKGKYISPGPIEMMLLRHPDIEQVCVVGMGVPQPIALVVLSAAGKAKSKDEIAASLGAAIASVNGQLEAYEQLKTAVVMREDWTIENGLLTPTLKVRRNEVEKIYLPHYSKWYLQQGTVVWA